MSERDLGIVYRHHPVRCHLFFDRRTTRASLYVLQLQLSQQLRGLQQLLSFITPFSIVGQGLARLLQQTIGVRHDAPQKGLPLLALLQSMPASPLMARLKYLDNPSAAAHSLALLLEREAKAAISFTMLSARRL